MSNLNEYLNIAIQDKAPYAIEYAEENNLNFQDVARLSDDEIINIVEQERTRIRESEYVKHLAFASIFDYPLEIKKGDTTFVVNTMHEHALYILEEHDSLYNKLSHYFKEFEKQLYLLRQYCFVLKDILT